TLLDNFAICVKTTTAFVDMPTYTCRRVPGLSELFVISYIPTVEQFVFLYKELRSEIGHPSRRVICS
ncbi:hypothetical protein L9F63_006749, partial [Diploptera punctata]